MRQSASQSIGRLGSFPLRIGVAACLVLDAAKLAQGQEPCLEFRADRAALDPVTTTIELEGGVYARCGPYELRAEQIRICVEGGEINVAGQAELALCQCKRAPIGIAFEYARIKPAGDVILTAPTLRVGETSVFWLPWMWLRAPHQVGLLLPRIGWRADGDLLLGTGVHVPWRSTEGAVSWLDLYASGYSRGGFEIEPSITTPTSKTTVRIDRMNGDLLRVDSEGYAEGVASRVAWRADAVGGKRGVTGLTDLRQAALPFDSAAAFVGVRPWSSIFVHAGMVGTGLRGTDRMYWGPTLAADASGAVTSGIAWSAMAMLRVVDSDRLGAAQLTSTGFRLFGGGWWGPTKLSIDGHAELRMASVDGVDTLDSIAWTASEVAVPLIRHYETVAHMVEPLVRVQVFGVARKNVPKHNFSPLILEQGARWLVLGGVRNAIGTPGTDSGVRWELSGGAIDGFEDESVRYAVLSRMGARAGVFGAQSEGVVAVGRGLVGGLVLGRVMVGSDGTVGVKTEVAARSRVDPVDASAFVPMELGGAEFGVLSEDGVSLTVGGHIPLGGGLSLQAASDWDLGKKRWLAMGAGVVLDHFCGCLQGRLWVSRRVGREGVDGWVGVVFR